MSETTMFTLYSALNVSHNALQNVVDNGCSWTKHYLPITDKIVLQQTNNQWVLFINQEKLFFPMGADVDLVFLLCCDAVWRPLSSKSESGISLRWKCRKTKKRISLQQQSHTTGLCLIVQLCVSVGACFVSRKVSLGYFLCRWCSS